jgi:hypothetical protein
VRSKVKSLVRLHVLLAGIAALLGGCGLWGDPLRDVARSVANTMMNPAPFGPAGVGQITQVPSRNERLRGRGLSSNRYPDDEYGRLPTAATLDRH